MTTAMTAAIHATGGPPESPTAPRGMRGVAADASGVTPAVGAVDELAAPLMSTPADGSPDTDAGADADAELDALASGVAVGYGPPGPGATSAKSPKLVTVARYAEPKPAS